MGRHRILDERQKGNGIDAGLQPETMFLLKTERNDFKERGKQKMESSREKATHI